MTSRELVIRNLSQRMEAAFDRGEFADAANIERFITSLDHMSDADYDGLLGDPDREGAIS